MTVRSLAVLCLLFLLAPGAAAQSVTTQPIFCPEGAPSDELSPFLCEDNWALDQLDADPPVFEDGGYSYSATGAGVHVFIVDLGIHVDESKPEVAALYESPTTLDDNTDEFGGRVLDDPSQSYHSPLLPEEDPPVLTTEDCSANSHGTRVASVIGGSRHGVAKGVWLHPMRWAFGCSSSAFATRPYLISALNKVKRVVQQGATPAVVNISFNLRNRAVGTSCEDVEGNTYDKSCAAVVSDLVQQLIDMGVTVVVSAGNRIYEATPTGNPESFAPSDVADAIVVGGLDRDRNRWERKENIDPDYDRFRCGLPDQGFGDERDCASNFGPAVDLWAPAEFIHAARNPNAFVGGEVVDKTVAENLGVLSGTSFAAPIVSGLAAIYLQSHPNATPAQVLAALKANAIDIGDVDDDGQDDLMVQAFPLVDPPPPPPPPPPPGEVIARDDAFSGVQGSTIELPFTNVFANDEPSGVWVKSFTQPAHGQVRWTNPAGMVYTPAPSFVGQDSFTYTITDGTAAESTATITVTVTAEPGDQVPVGGADSFIGEQDDTLAMLISTLLANDFDPDGDPLSIHDFTDAVHGDVRWTNPAGMVYTPPPGFLGSDSFTYRLTDGAGISAPVTVSIEVRAPNQPPVAADDHFSVSATRVLDLYFSLLFGNDVDPEGDALQPVGFTPAQHGTVRWTNPAGMVYTPDPGYVGLDSLTYTVEDPFGATSTATIHIEVMAAPSAAGDTVSTTSGSEVVVPYTHLLANDSGVGLWIDPAAFAGAAHGEVDTCCDPASFRYVPASGFTGSDTFTYRLEDTYGGTATGTVTVTVEDETPPEASFTAACTGLTCQLDAGGSSDDVGIASYTWSFGDGGGGSGVSRSRTYASRGAYTVTLTVADAAGNSDTASETVTVDGLPTASFTVSCTGRACSFDAAGSSDDGSIVSHAWSFGDGASGSGAGVGHTYAASGIYTARLTVTDDAGQTAETTRTVDLDLPPTAAFSVSCTLLTCAFNASASSDDLGIASYAWSFGNGTSGSGVSPSRTYATGGSYTVTLTVTDTGGHTAAKVKTATVNRPPVAYADAAVTDRNVAVVVPVLANDGDPDGQTPAISTWTQPAHGSVTAAGGGLSYQPAAGYTGSDSFTYRVTDGAALSGWATVAITVREPNLAPDARGVQLFVPGGNSKTIHYSTILTNDYDRDGHPLSIASFDTAGLAGTLSCNGTSCLYTPSWSGFRGVTSFRYTVSDGHGGTDTATVELKVGVSQNDPVAADDALATSRGQAVAFDIFDLLANDSDADGDVLKVTVGAPRFGSRTCTTPAYDCSYQPAAGFVGFDRLPYTVDDMADGTDTAGVRVFVAPGADRLDAREDGRFTWQNTAVWLPYAWMTANDYDPQGHPRTVTGVDTAGLNGSLTCNTGGCTYQPSSFFFGRTSFRYAVSDGHGETDTAVVTIHVGQQNQPPTIAADQLATPRNVALHFTIFDLLANDVDPETDPLTVTVYPSTAQGGTVTCSTPAYRCTFQPAAGFVGTASFLYLAGDGFNNGATATVSIQVQ